MVPVWHAWSWRQKWVAGTLWIAAFGVATFRYFGPPPLPTAPGSEPLNRAAAISPGSRALDRGTTSKRLGAAEDLGGSVLHPDGSPARSVKVVLVGSGVWPAREAQTFGDGTFFFEGVPDGVYELRAETQGLISPPAEGIEIRAGAPPQVTLRLEPSVSLEGRVVTDNGKLSVENATVLVRENSLSLRTRVGQTHANGKFKVPGLRRGVPLFVVVRAPGFLLREATVDSAHLKPVQLEVMRASQISGRVVDSQDRPVSGAQLHLVGESADGLPVHMLASMSEFQQSLSVASGKAPLPWVPSGDLGVTLGSVPPISASITLAALPLPPAPGSSAFESESDGTFLLAGVPAGSVRVVATHANFSSTSTAEISLQPGEVRSNVKVVMPLSGSLRGRVMDAGQFAVADTRVSLEGHSEPIGRTVRTTSDGSFSFDGVSGELRLYAAPPGLAPVERSIFVPPGQTVEVTVHVNASAHSLRGRVFDPARFGVAGVRLVVETRDGAQRVTYTDSDGTFELGGLGKAPYTVTATHEEHPDLSQVIEGIQEDEVSLYFSPGAHVLATVVDSRTGQPVSEARSTLGRGRSSTLNAKANKAGVLHFSRIEAGMHVLRIKAAGYVPWQEEVRLEPDDVQRPEIDLGEFALEPVGDEVLEELQGSPSFRAENVTQDEEDPTEALEGTAPSTSRTPGRTARRGVGLAVDLRSDQRGVWVSDVKPGSRAARAGMRSGDKILRIDGEAVLSAGQGKGMFRGDPKSTVRVVVSRKGTRLRLRVARERYEW